MKSNVWQFLLGLVVLGLFFITPVNAASQETMVGCGGNAETVIGCPIGTQETGTYFSSIKDRIGELVEFGIFPSPDGTGQFEFVSVGIICLALLLFLIFFFAKRRRRQ